MKRTILAVAVVALMGGTQALASPSLVCDATTDKVEYYVVSGLPSGMGAEKVLPDATKKNGFSLDLANLPAGSYTVTAKACVESWGCSDSSLPFQFSRPASPQSPANIKLSQ